MGPTKKRPPSLMLVKSRSDISNLHEIYIEKVDKNLSVCPVDQLKSLNSAEKEQDLGNKLSVPRSTGNYERFVCPSIRL